MADHPEGLGPDSDDDFVPWNSNPLQPAVEEDAAAASAQIPVETRDEVELESCRALAREDALSYLEHMKFVRMNAMRTRMEARKAILAATAEVCAIRIVLSNSEAISVLRWPPKNVKSI